MSNSGTKNLVKIIMALCGLSIISACGVSGDLKSAPPMIGKDKKAYEEKRANDAQLEKRKAEEEAKSKTNQ